MTITLNEEELAKLEFRIEKTTDRQDQPMRLVDASERLMRGDSWRYQRWDMFFVDVLIPMSALDGKIGVRTEFQNHAAQTFSTTASTWLKLARFFVEPNLQSPTQFSLNHQPNFLTQEIELRVSQATEAWFAKQPEYRQQVSWTRSAMLRMRELLVLADQFDADWWSQFQDNIDRMEGDE